MGKFEIGCLLGLYDKAHSFDNSSNWVRSLGSLTMNRDTTNTHSSQSAGHVAVFSGDSARWTYKYKDDPNDYDAKVFTGVNTHKFVSHYWGKISDPVSSGGVNTFLDNGIVKPAVPFAATDSLEHYRFEVDIASLGMEFSIINIAGVSHPEYQFYVDDVLTAIDVIELHPTRQISENYTQNKASHTSFVGQRTTEVWNVAGAWTVPLEYVSDEQARQINFWWENAFNLLWTFDSSDTSQNFVVRITNEGRPFQKLRPPYNNLWDGVLNLEAVTNGGEF